MKKCLLNTALLCLTLFVFNGCDSCDTSTKRSAWPKNKLSKFGFLATIHTNDIRNCSNWGNYDEEIDNPQDYLFYINYPGDTVLNITEIYNQNVGRMSFAILTYQGFFFIANGNMRKYSNLNFENDSLYPVNSFSLAYRKYMITHWGNDEFAFYKFPDSMERGWKTIVRDSIKNDSFQVLDKKTGQLKPYSIQEYFGFSPIYTHSVFFHNGAHHLITQEDIKSIKIFRLGPNGLNWMKYKFPTTGPVNPIISIHPSGYLHFNYPGFKRFYLEIPSIIDSTTTPPNDWITAIPDELNPSVPNIWPPDNKQNSEFNRWRYSREEEGVEFPDPYTWPLN